MIGVSKDVLLKSLPDYKDQWVTVKSKQSVPDIIDDILYTHQKFKKYYDSIGYLFEGSTLFETCEKLFWFCKDNIKYKEESEDKQSTALPAGILVRGEGDCKHYASFIAGCLSAIERMYGVNYNIEYCFASYKKGQPVPYHVFVIVQDDEGEIWIDPTPGADKMNPVWWVRKKV